jgi:hypothetical protein
MTQMCLGVIVFVVGCASNADQPLRPTQPPKTEPTKVPMEDGDAADPLAYPRAGNPDEKTLSPQEYAEAQGQADRCEQGARDLIGTNKNRAWLVLRTCVEKGRFTNLHKLLEGAWDKELQSRSDAPDLLARLIANRGGNVSLDLARLRAKRLPLFGLADAMGEPAQFRGRFVAMRSSVTARGVLRETGAARPTEFMVGAELADVQVDRRFVNYPGNPNNGEDDGGRGRAGRAGSVSGGAEPAVAMNDLETGIEMLGRLDKPDPFVVADDVYIVLARFEGVRKVHFSDSASVDVVPVLRLVAYYRPFDVSWSTRNRDGYWRRMRRGRWD